MERLEWDTVDGSEIRRSPVEVGSLSHYLQGSSTVPDGTSKRWLFGISEPSTVCKTSPTTSPIRFLLPASMLPKENRGYRNPLQPAKPFISNPQTLGGLTNSKKLTSYPQAPGPIFLLSCNHPRRPLITQRLPTPTIPNTNDPGHGPRTRALARRPATSPPSSSSYLGGKGRERGFVWFQILTKKLSPTNNWFGWRPLGV